MNSRVREVNLVLDVKLLVEILNVPVEGFDTYMRCERPESGEKEYLLYLTSKYTQKKEKLTTRIVGKG